MSEPLPLKRPATPDDLATIVRAADELGDQIKITGSDSLPLARFDDSRPVQSISTLRMNKIMNHAIADMTVAVHAGITLEALQKHLAWHDQWLPVDPPASAGRAPGGRTLGGMIASNSLGPLRLGLSGGDWRRLILGIRWVNAAGTLIKGGGQTVKNVAGYSSPRMLIGSAGALGVIAEVTLRTFARPADERCLIFFCPSPQRGEELLAGLLVSPTTPDYLQLVGGNTWSRNPLGLPAPPESLAGGAMILIAGYLGRAETCAAQVEIARALPAAMNIESIAQTAAQAGRLRLWMTSEPPAPAAEPMFAFRLHVLSSQTASLVAKIEQACAGAWVVSEAGSGIVRAAVWGAHAQTLLTELAHIHGSRLIMTQGHFPPAAPQPLVRRLKQALDPQSRFGHLP